MNELEERRLKPRSYLEAVASLRVEVFYGVAAFLDGVGRAQAARRFEQRAAEQHAERMRLRAGGMP